MKRRPRPFKVEHRGRRRGKKIGPIGKQIAPEVGIGCQTRKATKPENQDKMSTGQLAADVCRHLRHASGTFGPVLYDVRV